MQEIVYQGNELQLFQHATVWKNYFGSFIKPYLKGNILEVGAGIGSTTLQLCDGSQTEWICLEPDPVLFSQLEKNISTGTLPSCCIAIKGVITDLSPEKKFNVVIYIDVIEHIENDVAELRRVQDYLAPGGYLIILVPAHQFVYNQFDKSIGHYRRYNKKMLRKAVPQSLQLKRIIYLDSVGLLASIANKYSLKQNYPTMKQISFWDKVMVRISKFTDFLINYQTGKSLIAIWQKP